MSRHGLAELASSGDADRGARCSAQNPISAGHLLRNAAAARSETKENR
jgi:hypothetical protein